MADPRDERRARLAKFYEGFPRWGRRHADILAELEASERDREALALAIQFGRELAEISVDWERLAHGWHIAELRCPSGCYPDGTPKPCRFCEEPDDG